MTRRRVAFGLATWVATAITLSAQSPAPRSTGAVMAPDRLARLDRVLQDYVDDGRLPGAVALVLVDGRPVYEKAFGWADKEAGRKMTPDALFRIASQTKAITSTAILILMEEGRLQLTEPVSKYLPTFAKTTVAVRGANGAVEIVPAKSDPANPPTRMPGVSPSGISQRRVPRWLCARMLDSAVKRMVDIDVPTARCNTCSRGRPCAHTEAGCGVTTEATSS